MNLSSLTAILNKYLRIFRYGERPRPQRDWLIVIITAGVLLFVSAGWSYWLFGQISSEEVFTLGATQASTISTASLDTVKAIFDARATEKAHYLSDYHFVDPSH